MVIQIQVRGMAGTKRMLNNLNKANKKIGKEFTRDLAVAMKRHAKANLSGSGHSWTGDLMGSIRRETRENISRVYIDDPANETKAVLINNGVPKHKVSIDTPNVSGIPIREWFLSKGLVPFGRTVTVGIEPTHFWTRAINQTRLDAKKFFERYKRKIK